MNGRREEIARVTAELAARLEELEATAAALAAGLAGADPEGEEQDDGDPVGS